MSGTPVKNYILSRLIYLIYHLLRWTWKVTVIEPDPMRRQMVDRQPFILAHWHGDELALMQFLGHYRIATIVSTSKDGQLMNEMVHLMGARSSRGSSTRGGATALRGLIRLVREGHNCSFAVDGPKGPLYQVKPGVFEISRSLDLPIYYCGVACDRAFQFPRSWNKTFLPKPFARLVVLWQGPLPATPREADPRDPGRAQQLAELLHAAKQQALVTIAKGKGPG